MMIDDGKRVAAGGARLQWHMIPIADIDLIARNTRGEENGVTSTAEENAIRRRICVVSRIRDAEDGLVAHGNLAAPAAKPPLQHAGSCIVASFAGQTLATAGQEPLMMHKR